MNQKHGKGLFGFLAGITAGGLVALLTANRKGSDVRKDLAKEWSQGKPGTETLKKELKGIALGVKDTFEEVTSSPQFAKASKEMRKRFEEARAKAEVMLKEAEERASEYKDDAMDQADKFRKEVQKKAEKLMNDAKAAIMNEEEVIKAKAKKTVKKAKSAATSAAKSAVKTVKTAAKSPAKKSSAKKPAAK